MKKKPNNYKIKTLMSELAKMPEPYLGEALDFIFYLKEKKIKQPSESTLLSEKSLAKDWLKSNEDKAWKDL